MKQANRVAKNTGYLYGRVAITALISLYTTRLILDALGVSDFGIFNLVGGTIAMLGFLNAAMTSATMRFMSYSQGAGTNRKQKIIFNVSIILHILIALIMGIILYIAGDYLFDELLSIPNDRVNSSKIVYNFMIVSTMLTILTVPYDAILNAHENMFYYAIVGVFESFLKLGIAFIVVYAISDKLIIYGILTACLTFIVMVTKGIYCQKNYNECSFSPKTYFDKGVMLEMTSFAGWNFLTSAVSMVTNYGMGIILNMFYGTLLNAAQGVSTQLAGQLSMFSRNMMKALNPVIAKNEGAGNRNLMLKATSIGGKISFVLSLIVMAPFFVEAPFILSIWLKKIPEYTIIFTRLIIIIALFETFLISLSQSLMAEGNIRKVAITRATHAIIYLPIIYIFFYYGFKPASMYYLMIIKTIISLIIVIYFNKINCGLNISIYLKEVLFPCLLTLLMTLLLLYGVQSLFNESIFRLFMICLISFIFIILSSRYFILNIEEKLIAKKIVNSILKKLTL